jgi:hypothetical protein
VSPIGITALKIVVYDLKKSMKQGLTLKSVSIKLENNRNKESRKIMRRS